MRLEALLPAVWLIVSFVVGTYISRRRRTIVPLVIAILGGWIGWGLLTELIKAIVFIYERTSSMQDLVQ